MTMNALVSVAGETSSRVMPASSSRALPSEASWSPSPASNGVAVSPFLALLRKLTMPPTYSGTMSTLSGNVAM